MKFVSIGRVLFGIDWAPDYKWEMRLANNDVVTIRFAVYKTRRLDCDVTIRSMILGPLQFGFAFDR